MVTARGHEITSDIVVLVVHEDEGRPRICNRKAAKRLDWYRNVMAGEDAHEKNERIAAS
jgi:hypothetical protein